jgi:NmrA-like family
VAPSISCLTVGPYQQFLPHGHYANCHSWQRRACTAFRPLHQPNSSSFYHPFKSSRSCIDIQISLFKSFTTYLHQQAKPNLVEKGYQVVVVNYDNQQDLLYALRGTDLVISTISGSPQINLIDAAARAEVRRFVPADFEGPPTRRPNDDPSDRGRAASLDYLRQCSRSTSRRPMQFTTFTCGVFYERFARGGLASKGIGYSTGLEEQGAYLLDIEHNRGEAIEYSAANQPVHLCLTAVADVARFVVAALDLGINTWPAEFRMRGDRKTVTQIIDYAEAIKRSTYSFDPLQFSFLSSHLIPSHPIPPHRPINLPTFPILFLPRLVF